MYVYVCVCVYEYEYEYVHTHTYIYIYIYKYIHPLTYAVGNLYYFGVTKLLTSDLSNFEKIIRLVCTLSWG